MKVYTRTGDRGKTGIYGGLRCDKDDIRIECNGIIDEALSDIGVLRAMLEPDHNWQSNLYKIQVDIMDMMSHVATHSSLHDQNPINKPSEGATECEQWIDAMHDEMEGDHDYFVLPGGTKVSAQCHVVRSRLRTAERRLITLNKEDKVEPFIMQYINRLSDLFFTLARFEIAKSGLTEEKLRPFIMKFGSK